MSRPIQSIDDLQPLLDFYARTLGDAPGRLMAALSLLADLEYMDGWQETGQEVRLSVHLAGALVADVFKRLLAEQPGTTLQEEIEAMLARWTEQQQRKEE